MQIPLWYNSRTIAAVWEGMHFLNKPVLYPVSIFQSIVLSLASFITRLDPMITFLKLWISVMLSGIGIILSNGKASQRGANQIIQAAPPKWAEGKAWIKGAVRVTSFCQSWGLFLSRWASPPLGDVSHKNGKWPELIFPPFFLLSTPTSPCTYSFSQQSDTFIIKSCLLPVICFLLPINSPT